MSMREEFEAWYLTSCWKGVGPQSAVWEAWQASREALVIDLPQQSGVNLDWNQAIRYCHQAIEAVGVKVKS